MDIDRLILRRDTTWAPDMALNAKNQATLEAIFEDPTRANVPWATIETLFAALGATLKEGRGSRARVKLKDEKAVFHRPHPEPDADKGAVRSVRRFLTNAGVQP